MLIDAKSLDDGHILKADICVIGAGPAGNTLVRELMKDSRLSILLIEGGGIEFDADTQSLNEGTVVGRDYAGPAEVRRRQFGGTVNQWNAPYKDGTGARFVPLDPIDFEKRDWMPHSGWPFDRAHLDPFYLRVHEVCNVGPLDYDSVSHDPEYAPFKMDPRLISSGFYRYCGPEFFTSDALEVFKNAKNVTLCLNANAAEIVANNIGSAVEQIRLATLAGKKLIASAKIFVLASGALENPRLLLASNGIGNANDLVGRFLMDHPCYFFSEFVPQNSGIFSMAGFYDIHDRQGHPIVGRLTFPRELLEREKLLNFSVVLYPKAKGHARRGIEGLRAFRHARLLGISGAQRMRAAMDMLIGSVGIAGYAYGKLRKSPEPRVHYWFDHPEEYPSIGSFEPELYLEQEPLANNRVMLGQQTDRLGMRKIEVHWQWGKEGARTADKVLEILSGQFSKAGLGTVRRLRWPRLRGGSHHPTGTTRMNPDPKQGVVNIDCRVHGTANLYAAGSSVFPTSGYANPMLTIMAMSIRLADHLKNSETLRI